jgi:hypothetical protein
VAEVAAMCGVSDITVRVWITRRNLRRNARGRIDAAPLVGYLNQRKERGTPVRGDTPDPPQIDNPPNG